MKGKTTITITIGLVCFILTAVMFMQFKTISQTDITALENMQESDLRAEISSLKEENDEMEIQIDSTTVTIAEYRQKIATNQTASGLLDQELAKANKLVGKSQVSGQGVVVTLTDTEDRTVTASDLIMILNELKMAGAEAISINDQRIVHKSYVAAINNGYISINGNRQVSPYVIKVIGDPLYLESGLSAKQYGYIDAKKAEGLQITLQRSENIVIGSYIGNDIEFKYVK
ncbi:MAG: DUF881 domain-containing protein [Lachnospiraceae bacterium]|jgi:uncharacterized protein YlxW (UPF0749 family)|nr:DUF881 domain-containing protein [Lachnospiraceae bacterium]